MSEVANVGRGMAGLHRPNWRRRWLVAVVIWLVVAGGAHWLHRRAPIRDLILAPLPGWQVQVWLASQTAITHTQDRQKSVTVPIVMIFYTSPFTGIRFLGRFTVPAWPLELSTGVLMALGLLGLRWPVLARWHAWRYRRS